MRKTCLPPSSLNWPLHRFFSNLYKIKKVVSMKFHATINKAKKNQPSSWAKTALGIAENKGRSWKKDKENISDWKLFTVDKRRKISGWTWQTLPKTAFCKVLAVLKTISFLCNIKCLLFKFFLSGTSLQYGRANKWQVFKPQLMYFLRPTYWLLRLRFWKK